MDADASNGPAKDGPAKDGSAKDGQILEELAKDGKILESSDRQEVEMAEESDNAVQIPAASEEKESNKSRIPDKNITLTEMNKMHGDGNVETRSKGSGLVLDVEQNQSSGQMTSHGHGNTKTKTKNNKQDGSSSSLTSAKKMGNTPSDSEGIIDEKSERLLLQDNDLPDLEDSLARTLVKNGPVSSGAGQIADGSSNQESLEELNQADLAALLPEITNEPVVSFLATESSRVDRSEDELNGNEKRSGKMVRVESEESRRLAEVGELRMTPATAADEDGQTTSGKTESNSLRKSRRSIKHPLWSADFLTMENVRGMPPVKSVSPSRQHSASLKLTNLSPANPPLTMVISKKSTEGEMVVEKRRGRPKGAKNKKTLEKGESSGNGQKNVSKTDSIRESILEKLHVELFGHSSSGNGAVPVLANSGNSVRLQKITTGKTRGRPRSRPIIEGKRIPFQNSAVNLSFSRVPAASSADASSNSGFEERLGTVSWKSGSDSESSRLNPLKKLTRHPESSNLGSCLERESLQSSDKKSKESNKVHSKSSKTKAGSSKNAKSDNGIYSFPVLPATNPPPYPSQLAAGFNAIGNIGLGIPLFSRPSTSSFSQSSTVSNDKSEKIFGSFPKDPAPESDRPSAPTPSLAPSLFSTEPSDVNVPLEELARKRKKKKVPTATLR